MITYVVSGDLYFPCIWFVSLMLSMSANLDVWCLCWCCICSQISLSNSAGFFGVGVSFEESELKDNSVTSWDDSRDIVLSLVSEKKKSEMVEYSNWYQVHASNSYTLQQVAVVIAYESSFWSFILVSFLWINTEEVVSYIIIWFIASNRLRFDANSILSCWLCSHSERERSILHRRTKLAIIFVIQGYVLWVESILAYMEMFRHKIWYIIVYKYIRT